MATYKLLIEEDELNKSDLQVIAIHTSLEDYRLAFFLNRALKINLCRNKIDVKLEQKKDTFFFNNFIFEDQESDVCWNLIQNEIEIEHKQNTLSQDLFAKSDTEFLTKVFFIPEFKKVNFFMKLEGANELYEIKDLIAKINSIDRISTVYEIELDNLKSKNNLIF